MSEGHAKASLTTGGIVLGTAQLVQRYGAEVKAEPELSGLKRPKRILERARDFGIVKLDTAPSYGEAEVFIGMNAANSFSIQTKFSARNNERVESQIRTSLKRLKVSYLEAAILHDPFKLTSEGEQAILDAIALHDSGIVRRLGVSIYTSADLKFASQLLRNNPIIQMPGNIFTENLWTEPELMQYREQGATLQLRSLFMQGMLVKSAPISRHHDFPNIEKGRQLLCDLAEKLGIGVKTILLVHAFERLGAHEIVVGVSDPTEFDEIEVSHVSDSLRLEILEGITEIQHRAMPSEHETNPLNW